MTKFDIAVFEEEDFIVKVERKFWRSHLENMHNCGKYKCPQNLAVMSNDVWGKRRDLG